MWIRPALALLALILLFILISPASPITFRFDTDADIETAVDAVAEDRSDREKMIDERFSVREGETLVVNVADADVRVVPGNSSEVHVEVYLEGEEWDRAVDYFEKQHFRVEQHGEAVVVETDAEQTNWNFRRSHPQISVEIQAPERFNAELRTSDGDIFLERLDGRIALRTSDGDIAAGRLSGPVVGLKTSDGDIRLESAHTADLALQTSDGDIILDTGNAERIALHTSDGDIRAEHLEANGEISLRTSDGDIRLDAARAARVTLRSSDGNISTGILAAEQTSVSVSDGDIHLERVDGDLEASGGDADLRIGLARAGRVTLHTGDGDIVLTVPADLNADLRLRGSDVRVASRFSFQGRVDEHHAEGTLNGGGPLVEARASDGTVTLDAN